MLSLSTDGRTSTPRLLVRRHRQLRRGRRRGRNTGDVKWLADCHGDTYDAAPMNGNVYAVSHWHYCRHRRLPRHQPALGLVPRQRDDRGRHRHGRPTTARAATPTSTASPPPSMVNWFPDMPSGTFTGQSQAGWTTEGHQPVPADRRRVPPGQRRRPAGPGALRDPLARAQEAGPPRLRHPFNPTMRASGRPGQSMEGQLGPRRPGADLRGLPARPGHPVYTTTATSQFWNRPTLSPTTPWWPGRPTNTGCRPPTPTATRSQRHRQDHRADHGQPVRHQRARRRRRHYWRMNGAGTSPVTTPAARPDRAGSRPTPAP